MTFRFHRIGLFVVGLLLGLGLIAGGFLLWRLARSRGETMGSSGTAPTVNRVVYLAPSARPELWRAASDGSQQRQLTQSGGKVYDYAVWSDGSRLVYSAANELGGLSLWTMTRDGGDVTLVLDCGADRCFEPAVSPNGRQIAYSRENRAENPGGGAGISRVWVVDIATLRTTALYGDARIAGSFPSWSPDGRFLAFYNPREGAIQIHPLQGGKDLVASSRLEGVGAWSPDSSRMIFAGLLQDENSATGTLSQIEIQTGNITSVFPDLLFVDFGEPVFSGDGNSIAVAARSPGELSARPIWVLRLKGQEIFRISEDAQQSQGGYHWEPGSLGNRLLYQQILPGNPSQPPELFVYDLTSRTARRIAKDAFLPTWLPGSQ